VLDKFEEIEEKIDVHYMIANGIPIGW